MSRKKIEEKVIGAAFLVHLCQVTAIKLSIHSYGEKPDLVCRDKITGKTVGIEITNLFVNPQVGKARKDTGFCWGPSPLAPRSWTANCGTF